jgi:cytochrome c556
MLLAVAVGGPSPSAQTRQLSQVMRMKLDHSKDILEALVTSDWQLLDRASRDMAGVADDPAWRILTMPEYVRQSEAFLRATDDLIDAAERRDLEAASLGYVSLTTSCVSCHRYVARSRIVRREVR